MRLRIAVVAIGTRQFADAIKVEVILQIGPHLRLVEDDIDPERGQLIRRSDPRQLQQPRGADRPRTEQHFAFRPQARAIDKLDPGGAAILDHDPAHLRTRLHREVLAVTVGRDIGHRSRGAAHIALGQLVIGDPVLLLAVHVVIARDTKLGSRFEIGLADRQGRTRIAHAERAALAVIPVLEARVILGLAEIGQHVLIAPAGASHLTPFVVIARIATGIDLRVDRGAAADHLGLRVAKDLVLHVALRNRVPTPAADALGHLREARGQMIERVAIAAARLEQQHVSRRVLGETPGQHRARRTTADNDEIVSRLHAGLLWPSLSPQPGWLRRQALSVRYARRRAGRAPRR